jgi:hypothetical protein
MGESSQTSASASSKSTSTSKSTTVCAKCNELPATFRPTTITGEEDQEEETRPLLLVCGRCRNVSYCTKECQKDHWSIHKYVCSSKFELFDSIQLGGGKGLRVTHRPIRCGEEIFRESAILCVPTRQAAASRQQAEAMHARAVQACFEALPASKQRAFMTLSVCDQWLEADGGTPTPHGVFQTNSYQLKGEDNGAVFIGIARMNHSCRPNVNHTWRPDLQKTLVLATRDIAVGEELCTTYGPSECLDTSGRRSYLKENFSFDCQCQMCHEGNSLGGDDRMKQLNDLHASIPDIVRKGGHQRAIEIIDECIGLLVEQGIGSGVFTKPLFEYGHQVARMGLKDKELAKSYLLKEIEAVVQCEGDNCPDKVRLEQIFASLF